MKQIAVILILPYLAPITLLILAEYFWNIVTNTPQSTATFSGGQVPSFYVLIPIALVIQIFFGIPGSLILWRSSSRRVAILCCTLMAGLPFLLLRAGSDSSLFALSSLLPIVGITTFFGVGFCVSFYFLHHKKKTEQNAVNNAEEAI